MNKKAGPGHSNGLRPELPSSREATNPGAKVMVRTALLTNRVSFGANLQRGCFSQVVGVILTEKWTKLDRVSLQEAKHEP